MYVHRLAPTANNVSEISTFNFKILTTYSNRLFPYFKRCFFIENKHYEIFMTQFLIFKAQ